MLIQIKKNGTLKFNKFSCKCALGKNGLKSQKKEGDYSTPKGIFSLGKIYFREDRLQKIKSPLKIRKIKKNMGWCNDSKDISYNKEINLNSKKKGEKLFRKDNKYDAFIIINHNSNPVIPDKGSAIFLHLTKNYAPTMGCIAIKKDDFFKLLNLINSKTKIKI
jgi:L,D-peptidoglycan transpeptidase YkuD (ErfK/YbiS/YcfS/YnhG family)